jgi:hypothetical protein
MTGDNRVWGLSGVNYIDFGRESKRGLFVADHFLPAGGKWDWPTVALADEPSWCHVAVVYDGEARQVRHYFNGKRMFAGPCEWKAVEFDPKLEAVFPPQYPQLQIGMRDPIQQWDHHELHGVAAPRKRFHGWIDEMRFSDAALYDADFNPPGSFAAEARRPAPARVSSTRPASRPAAPRGGAEESSRTVRQVGDRRQLFIDRRFIASSENIRLVQNAPERVDFDFPADKGEGALAPSNVIYLPAAKTWRMYYAALGRSSLRYMESADGLHWVRPVKDNVIVQDADRTALGVSTGVMLDEHDVPERRFKAFEDRYSPDAAVRGIYAYFSADGLTFTPAGRVLPMSCEGQVSATFDPKLGKYVALMRAINTRGGLKMVQGDQFFYRPDGSVDAVDRESLFKPGLENLRAIGRIETDDLLKPWPYNHSAPPTFYTTAEHIPMVLCADGADGFVDFYTAAAWRYPYAEDVYLAFPSAFRHFHPSRQPGFYKFDDANGPIEIQLATSRDGVHWDRHDRAAYTSTGTTGQRDRWLNMMGVAGVRSGDWIYQYYWSPARLHDSLLLRPDADPAVGDGGGHLFALRQRLDGFVSADVDYRGGWLVTPPLVFSGKRLLLNHNCNATGTIFVELRDPDGTPIAGFTLAECQEITGNDTGWEVRWRDGGADVSKLAGRPVRICFRMRNAKLYAFQFAP